MRAEREADIRQLQKSHRYTQIGLWFSGIATLIAASGFYWAVFKG